MIKISFDYQVISFVLALLVFTLVILLLINLIKLDHHSILSLHQLLFYL